MEITYRDELGVIVREVNEDGVDFLDGYAYFTSDDKDYEVLVEDVVHIG